MPNYDNTIPAVTNSLKNADSYLESEKLVIQNVKQQLKDGFAVTAIDDNLKKLHNYITKQAQEKATTKEAIGLKYAAACLTTLITTPYWHSWIEVV